MFSFRPDTEAPVLGFVPTPVATIVPRALEAEALGEDAGDPESTVVEESLEAPAPTPEKVAALEQAAFDRGVETARAEQSALDALCAGMDGAIAEWRATTSTLLAKNREHLLDLTHALVRHWVGAELESRPETYAAYLDRALEGLGGAADVRLVVAEADLARLESHVAESLGRWREAGVEIAGDASMSPGSFLVETPSTEILGDLDRIATRLREALAPAVVATEPEHEPGPETVSVDPGEVEA